MPIDSDEFDKGYTNDTIKGQIEKLLSDCKAYSLSEIMSHLYMSVPKELLKPSLDWTLILYGIANSYTVNTKLDELERLGKIDRRYVERNGGRETYFRKRGCV